jgi:hypothetical protein
MPPTEELILRVKGWKLLLVFLPPSLLMVVSMCLDFDCWRNMSGSDLALFAGVWLCILSLPVLMTRRYYLQLSPEGLKIQWKRRGRSGPTWPCWTSAYPGCTAMQPAAASANSRGARKWS